MIQGLPWEPVPGRNHVEVKSHFQYKEEEEIVRLPGSRESMPRRIYIRKEDVADSKYGLTIGCRGCEAANRGLVGVHSEDCRIRIEKLIALKEPERFDRVNKVLTQLGTREEEAKSEEAEGGGQPPLPGLKRARTRLEKSKENMNDMQDHSMTPED